MKIVDGSWLVAVVVASAIAGCTAADKSAEPAGNSSHAADKSAKPGEPASVSTAAPAMQEYEGWYMVQDGRGALSPCMQATQLQVESPELRARLQEPGADPANRLYVRLSGTLSADGSELLVSKVAQVGPPIPEHGCTLTGLPLPKPTR